MASAALSIWPEALFGFGPETEDGFYYDISIPNEAIKEEDLPRIEKRMTEIVKADHPFVREEVSREEALKIFSDQKFKIDALTNGLLKDAETVSIYRSGEFVDLCRGPHLESTGSIGAFKLVKLAGAYWLGDSSADQLQRIYGLLYDTRDKLKARIKEIEEAKKRDHRVLSKRLKLFSFRDEGPGFPFMLPAGRAIFNRLIDHNRAENDKRGYLEVSTPQMLETGLWDISGHTDYYKEHIYFSEVEKRSFAIKPMNCPGSVLLYKEERRSFRGLPLRMSEFGLVHRHELSGTLHGLFRARAFTQDDAHIYCAESDLESELVGIIDYTLDLYKTFGFEDVMVYVATRPEKSIGEPELWDRATAALKSALERRSMSYRIKDGEGAFYGPKIEFNIKDSLGRLWQLGTAQLDFFLPERFDLYYIDSSGQKRRPALIHRAIYGSLERFIGILIEHYNGAFPVWLAPTQAILIPVTDGQERYAERVAQKLAAARVRVELDRSEERIGKKIRNAQLMKIPYMIVVGAREASTTTVSVRLRSGEDLGAVSIDESIELIDQIDRSKSFELITDEMRASRANRAGEKAAD